MNAIETLFTFFERLGVSAAMVASGTAIIHYNDRALSWWPLGAVLGGMAVIFIAYFLGIWAASDCFVKLSVVMKKKFREWLLAATVVTAELFFLSVGGHAAIAALG